MKCRLFWNEIVLRWYKMPILGMVTESTNQESKGNIRGYGDQILQIVLYKGSYVIIASIFVDI